MSIYALLALLILLSMLKDCGRTTVPPQPNPNGRTDVRSMSNTSKAINSFVRFFMISFFEVFICLLINFKAVSSRYTEIIIIYLNYILGHRQAKQFRKHLFHRLNFLPVTRYSIHKPAVHLDGSWEWPWERWEGSADGSAVDYLPEYVEQSAHCIKHLSYQLHA